QQRPQSSETRYIDFSDARARLAGWLAAGSSPRTGSTFSARFILLTLYHDPRWLPKGDVGYSGVCATRALQEAGSAGHAREDTLYGLRVAATPKHRSPGYACWLASRSTSVTSIAMLDPSAPKRACRSPDGE